MTEIQAEVARHALAKMVDEGYFSISAVDEILKLTGGVPAKEDYDALRALHCVKFRDMSQRLRQMFPTLLERVLSSPSMRLSIRFEAQASPRSLMPALPQN